MIGRIKERKQLDELLLTPDSELVAVIGRRRIGKTYLIREHYKKQMVFDFTGTQDAKIHNQLKKFSTKDCVIPHEHTFFKILRQKNINMIPTNKRNPILVNDLCAKETCSELPVRTSPDHKLGCFKKSGAAFK